MKLGTVKIDGKPWTVRTVSRLGPKDDEDLGQCSYETRQIKLSQRQDAASMRNTLIHELIHAQFPWMTEDAVGKLERVISDGLNLLGDP